MIYKTRALRILALHYQITIKTLNMKATINQLNAAAVKCSNPNCTCENCNCGDSCTCANCK
jgi:hypothetical protein